MVLFNDEDHLEYQLNVQFPRPSPGDSDSVGLGWGGKNFYEPRRLLVSAVWEHCSGMAGVVA